ncbi:hypothetical protein BJ546DRAFT_1061580 [Cryomyces antarcticus]
MAITRSQTRKRKRSVDKAAATAPPVADSRPLKEIRRPRVENVPFPFLKLPPELRNAIYARVVVLWAPIWVHTLHTTSKQVLQPPLSRVCKQVRAECLAVFYSCNAFEGLLLFPPHCGVLAWLTRIGRTNCATLRQLRIDARQPHNPQLLLGDVEMILGSAGVAFCRPLVPLHGEEGSFVLAR